MNIRLPWKALHEKRNANSDISIYSFVYNSGNYFDSFIKIKLHEINKSYNQSYKQQKN